MVGDLDPYFALANSGHGEKKKRLCKLDAFFNYASILSDQVYIPKELSKLPVINPVSLRSLVNEFVKFLGGQPLFEAR